VGISEKELDWLVGAASKVTRLLANNPKELTEEDIRSIYQQVM
jgi:alcohol dehydrogenase class IV